MPVLGLYQKNHSGQSPASSMRPSLACPGNPEPPTPFPNGWWDSYEYLAFKGMLCPPMLTVSSWGAVADYEQSALYSV